MRPIEAQMKTKAMVAKKMNRKSECSPNLTIKGMRKL
jgi:hypothetical protein